MIEKTIAQKQKRGSRFERHRCARVLAIQACFEAQFHHLSTDQVTKRYISYRMNGDGYSTAPDPDLFVGLLKVLGDRQETITSVIHQSVLADWNPARMDSLLRSILSIALAEMIEPQTKAPIPVIISEYVHITQGFFDFKESAYVNKVLDMAAKNLALQTTKNFNEQA